MTCNTCTVPFPFIQGKIIEPRKATIDEAIQAAFHAAYDTLMGEPLRNDYGMTCWYKNMHLQEMREIGPQIIFKKTRRKAVVAARFMVFWYMNKVLGMTQERVNDLFGRDRTGVSFAINRINNRRFDPFLNSVYERFNKRVSFVVGED